MNPVLPQRNGLRESQINTKWVKVLGYDERVALFLTPSRGVSFDLKVHPVNASSKSMRRDISKGLPILPMEADDGV